MVSPIRTRTDPAGGRISACVVARSDYIWKRSRQRKMGTLSNVLLSGRLVPLSDCYNWHPGSASQAEGAMESQLPLRGKDHANESAPASPNSANRR